MPRKNTECNPIELLVALMAIGKCMVDPRTIQEKPDWLVCEQFEEYKENLGGVTNLNSSAINFALQRPHSWNEFSKVYLTGKRHFDHPKLVGLDRKTTKADVYLEKEDGTLIGISVKQSKQATKSNYSVEKMMGDEGQICKKIRKQYLADNGFHKHNSLHRSEVNALFYDRFNPYWTAIRSVLAFKQDFIKKELVKFLYSCDSPIEMWEFDGTDLKPICLSSEATITFGEHESYYNGNCAKMFYKLVVEDRGIRKDYRVELRWKGNVHTASPQFQIHSI